MADNQGKRRKSVWPVLVIVVALVAAACGGDSGSEAVGVPPPPEPTPAPAPTPEPAPEPPAPAPEPPPSAEPVEVAYLSASTANTWLAASRAAMLEVAAANNIEIVEFDAQFDPAQQQFQDAIAAGRYADIILVSLAGAGSIPDVEDALAAGIEDALAAGIEVVFLNQVVGEDFTDVEPQAPGVAAAVFEPPYVRGERLGQVTVATCEGFDPCNVVYFYGVRGFPLDEAVRQGWDSVTAGSTVNVVAEAEGQYLGPDVGLAAMQDIFVSTSDIDVVVGADQSMQGVEIALADEGVDDVRIIGFGGSTYAVQAIQDGRWYAGLFGAPFTEGRLAMEAMVAALGGTDTGGIDPALSVPNSGLMFGDNANDFEAEWDG